MVQIKRTYLTEDNLLDIRLLDRTCFPTDDPVVLDRGWWWLCHVDGKYAGYAGLCMTAADQKVGYLCRSGVKAKYRGLGIQRRFIRARGQLARQVGMHTIVTDTHKNIYSSNNLMACGYRLYDPQHPWGCKESLYWIKTL